MIFRLAFAFSMHITDYNTALLPPGVSQLVKLARPRSVTRQRNMNKLVFHSVSREE